jgi:hypothetical protein
MLSVLIYQSLDKLLVNSLLPSFPPQPPSPPYRLYSGGIFVDCCCEWVVFVRTVVFMFLWGEENLFVIRRGHGIVFGVAQSFIDI